MKWLTFVLLSIPFTLFAQDYSEHQRYGAWTFHTHNTTIHGISVGAFPPFDNEPRYVRTNGIRLELPGWGFLAFMGNGSMIRTETPHEIVNGLNISSGTIDNISYNGVTLALVNQSGTEMNGLALAGFWQGMGYVNGLQATTFFNEAHRCNGVQAALVNQADSISGLQLGILNRAEESLKGVQIGLFNHAEEASGIQIGLWNVIDGRSFPFVNW